MSRQSRGDAHGGGERRGPSGAGGSVRIIGGRLRGRRLAYHGDPRTRPMKDRVREAVFNLVATEVQGKEVLDLFAGTGALGLEAISRGAARAVLIEQHFPTVRLIQANLAAIGVAEQVEVVAGNAFFWAPRLRTPQGPWLIFCSPPYDFYVERADEMLDLIRSLLRRAPAESVLVVEADERFDARQLPDADRWEMRTYPPAVVAILRTTTAMGSASQTTHAAKETD